ncbi:DNA polymerase III subunit delta [Crocinitomicaceae bacterium CZZ-1]|uniref:DNA polymerase III subunit delta n=1 Tax=Taishania pollutisoli TaxID=2766479 RepID=A0A8J6TTT6_9FLAO|nr:DNA polymerase III subunit delta [Taishania pollutisoli]MBC9813344.1 DNA polymerase III subunit delta [Taishania pollutisoli]MBX2948887.1 DNA polymerase III subunit delta [Crocinitomicaceae bacterium]NGF77068.1 DNA polymerase III subunit delta [Fluviicola sp. SGL-29]
MDHKLIIKNIKQHQFEKIYFLHGEEPFFIDAITDAIVENAMDDSERDFNQTIVYGKECEAGAIIADAKSYPMMGERRLVIIKEAQEFKDIDLLESYFNNPVDTTIFVICYKHKKFDTRKKLIKVAAANGLVFLSEKVRDYKLVDWISSYAKEVGYQITPKAAMLLAEFLGTDISRVVNELDKLSILIEKGTAINEVHIEENIGISKDYNFFELANAFAERDYLKASKIVNYFEKNPKMGPLIPVISNLFGYHTKLMRIHFAKDKSPAALASVLGVAPFLVAQYTKAAKIYNPKKLAENIAILQEYDLKSKGIDNSSSTDGELMKEMVYRLMN